MTFRAFVDAVHGNTSMMMALAVVPLLLAAGAGVDMANVMHTKAVLQGAADAAALAGASTKNMSKQELDAVVQDYLRVNDAMHVLEVVSKIEHDMDKRKGVFSVSIDGKISTSFMKLAGFDQLDVGARAEVNMGSQALELALVLDNTGSMSGAKIQNLKTAANELVNIIERSKSDYSTVKIGVVPFSEYVSVGTRYANASWLSDPNNVVNGSWEGCVGSRDHPEDESVTGSGSYPAVRYPACTAALLPLTENFAAVRRKINGMIATGYTYIPGGLLWGWNILDNAAPFTEGMSKRELKDARGRKAIVLMTDGENTVYPRYPTHAPGNVSVANAKLTTICDNVKSENIEIFTVSFMVPSETIKDLLVQCASKESNYFDADNAEQLYDAFRQIGNSLSAVRLTR